MFDFNSDIGLYFHIPFCSRICSYCDFRKTSIYNPETISSYLKKISKDFLYLKNLLSDYNLFSGSFYSCYLGGGTPSLITSEYEELFHIISPFLDKDAEITIESNPQDITEDNLRTWSSYGINRLSIGIQSFNREALLFLTRDLLPKERLIEIIQLSKQYFNNINIDLIYGLPIKNHQKIFFDDLLILQDKLHPQHISLYCLSYSSKTPLGLRLKRGLVDKVDDDTCAFMYEKIQNKLKTKYINEEVSNWYQPGYPAKHSNLYWSQGYYLGVGPGACGFLPSNSYLQDKFKTKTPSQLGYRYSYKDNLTSFLNPSHSITDLIQEDPRDSYSYLCEYIGCCLRSLNGINLERIQTLTDYRFTPSSFIKQALKENLLILKGNTIYLREDQWFLEMSWSKKLIESFVKDTKK